MLFRSLVRWNHPARGVLLPAAFIPIAETSGLIVPLGEWVLREACRTAVELRARPGHARLGMCVNLSPVQLSDPALPASLAQVLDDSGLQPSALVVEVTETALSDPLAVAATLQALHDLGVRIAIDDFGTGYSSLSHLGDFAIDILKIDRSFVHALDGRSVSRGHRLVAGIIGLADSLGLSTVAEGIESPLQLNQVRRLGCAEGQGTLWSGPVPAADLEATFARLSVSPRRSRPARLPAGGRSARGLGLAGAGSAPET